jgi:hypothetical protein
LGGSVNNQTKKAHGKTRLNPRNVLKVFSLFVVVGFICLSSSSCVSFDSRELFESLNPNLNLFILHISASLVIIMLAI